MAKKISVFQNEEFKGEFENWQAVTKALIADSSFPLTGLQYGMGVSDRSKQKGVNMENGGKSFFAFPQSVLQNIQKERAAKPKKGRPAKKQEETPPQE